MGAARSGDDSRSYCCCRRSGSASGDIVAPAHVQIAVVVISVLKDTADVLRTRHRDIGHVAVSVLADRGETTVSAETDRRAVAATEAALQERDTSVNAAVCDVCAVAWRRSAVRGNC